MAKMAASLMFQSMMSKEQQEPAQTQLMYVLRIQDLKPQDRRMSHASESPTRALDNMMLQRSHQCNAT